MAAVSIEEALRAWLADSAAVAPLVGATPGVAGSGQIFKESIPQTAVITGSQGAIAYQVASDARGRTLAGIDGDKTARVVLTLEAASEAALSALWQAVWGTPLAPGLDGVTARQLGAGAALVWAQYVRLEDRPEDFVPSPHAADAGTFLAHLAVHVSYHSP